MRTLSEPQWQRDGDNLYFTVPISLSEALTNTIISVSTFDGRLLSVPVNGFLRERLHCVMCAERHRKHASPIAHRCQSTR